ncbi:MAG: hypothetical protein LBU04_06635 [Christensenellaceae bacterium]|nr:hypothetical protein [Christensenellaceae bacterium]
MDTVISVIEKNFGSISAENTETANVELPPLSTQEVLAIKKLKLQEPPEDRMSDGETIELAMSSRRTGAEFSSLYSGNWPEQG